MCKSQNYIFVADLDSLIEEISFSTLLSIIKYLIDADKHSLARGSLSVYI